jgi:glycosyltransferase involved in cell wall biosynthesis
VRTKFRLPPRFVLQVGTVEPRKDVHLLAAACRAVDIPLVLAGGGSIGPLLPDGVIGLGYVDVADLPALYCAATAVAYCSIYEGFGLPPVEAMACGAAVVASSVGALPDVVGDGAALVTRHDVEAWAGLLRDVVHDSGHAQHLRVHGPDAAASLTWHATAQSTVEAYGRAGLTF